MANRFEEDHANKPGDATVGPTGAVPGRLTQGRLIKEALPRIELVTVLLIALIVGLHFRSVGPPLLALVAAGISYLVAIRVVSMVAAFFGLGLPEELEPLIVVLLLGIVTDYSIFVLSAMESNLREGMRPLDAASRAAAGIMRVIVTAGLTVAAGTSALAVATLDVFKALGPGLGLTVFVGLVVSMNVHPRLSRIAGDSPLLAAPSSGPWRTLPRTIPALRDPGGTHAPYGAHDAAPCGAARGSRMHHRAFSLVGLHGQHRARLRYRHGFARGQ
jgi:RND superfamily putative drug exporter